MTQHMKLICGRWILVRGILIGQRLMTTAMRRAGATSDER